MQLNLQGKDDFTLDREIEGITIDDDGTVLVLKYKGLEDSDVCADIVDADTKMMNELKAGESTRNQLKVIRKDLAVHFKKYLSGWNIEGLEVNAKSIELVLKNQTALWDIRNDFIDLVTEAATGTPRSQREDEIKNFITLAQGGSKQAM